MAAFNKFQQFVGDVGLGVHNLDTGVLRIHLTNTAPVATNTVYNPSGGTNDGPADLATGGGYTAKGVDTAATYSQSGGTGSCVGTDVVWTATTGFGPFRYVVLYNDTPTSPADPLIGWWDYGSSITLLASETFTTDFGATMFTIV